LIEVFKKAHWDSGSSSSYKYLSDNLSSLSIDNINDKKSVILRFLADSYYGDNQIAIQISEFIDFYTKK